MKKLLIFVSFVFLAGCASIFSSKVSNIPVKTTPEDAVISVYANSGGKIFEGKTPCIISLNKKDAVDGKVIISQKGYKDVQVSLGRNIELWGIANGCCFLLPGFVIGGGIDFLTGNLIKPEIETINIILEPDKKNSTNDLKSDFSLVAKSISIDIQKRKSECILFIGE